MASNLKEVIESLDELLSEILEVIGRDYQRYSKGNLDPIADHDFEERVRHIRERYIVCSDL